MLPFRSGRSEFLRTAGFLLMIGTAAFSAFAAEPKAKPSPDPKAKSVSLTNIPLPVGQEAKGLVLPDFDTQGHLRARFEAGSAVRVDAGSVEFKGLKVTTFTPDNALDLSIDMPRSTLDLATRVITSTERTTVRRIDFDIAGDTLRFDTVARKGTFVGNVKMVITGHASQPEKARE